jgi:hypothetical protein
MKIINSIYKLGFIACMLVYSSCDSLDNLNENPNGVAPADANPNLMLPSVMRPVATDMVNLGFGDVAGVVQHTQKDGWFTGHNHYDWNLQDWGSWYNLLRTNNFLEQRADELGFEFHKGVSLAMKSLIFGTITDLWGDAPYTMALRGDQSGLENEFPEFDSQEVIYPGIIADLQQAAQIFSTGNNEGIIPEYDLYFGGNTVMWHKFTNSILLRYYLRISEKMPEMAKEGIEQVYASGVYLMSSDEDVFIDYVGASAGDSWPSATDFDAGSSFRRIKPCSTLLDKMLESDDPRTEVWFRPVHCQWVEDTSLDVAYDPYIRENGQILNGVISFQDAVYLQRIAEGNVYTRHYNPEILGRQLDTGRFVGLPPGLQGPSDYNLNPTGGQQLENQHASQLSDTYRERNGGILKARIISASEVHFILSEAAFKGWAVGDAETHYYNGIKSSLETWGVGDAYESHIQKPQVAFSGSLEQIIEQKWIASWTVATESWFDFRRTGYPAFVPGPASPEPVLPVRFNYGNNEINFNSQQVGRAIERLEVTQYEGNRGPNNPWSKPWLIQQTGNPW